MHELINSAKVWEIILIVVWVFGILYSRTIIEEEQVNINYSNVSPDNSMKLIINILPVFYSNGKKLGHILKVY